MNRTYQTIWSEERRSLVVVSELTSSRTKSGSRSEAAKKAVRSVLRYSALAVAVASALTAGLIPLSASAAPDRMIEIGGYKFASTYDGVSSFGPWHPAEDTSSTVVDWSFDFDTNNGQEVLEGQTFEITAGQYTMWESMAATGHQSLKGDAQVLIQGGTTPGAYVFNALADGPNAFVLIEMQNLSIRGGAGNAAINTAATNGADVTANVKEVVGGSAGNAYGIGIGAYGVGSYLRLNTTMVSGGTVDTGYGIAYLAQNGGSADLGGFFISGANATSAIFAAAMSTNGSNTKASINVDTISGGASTAINFGAYGNGSYAHFSSTAGDWTISGGDSEEAFGIGTLAFGNGSRGIIFNDGYRTLNIVGGSGDQAYGIESLAGGEYLNYDSYAALRNSAGGGTVVISGGSGVKSYGISEVAYGNASYGEIVNEGEGVIEILGGEGSGSYGINYNAMGEGSEGLISNLTGTLTIQGGKPTANGLNINGADGGVGTVTNAGSGSLSILGGEYSFTQGISSNAYSGGTGTISNTGSGSLLIKGGSQKYESRAYGMINNASGKGSTGFIVNTADGDLTVQGGDGRNDEGIKRNAASGGSGTISNTGSGELQIFGGSEDNAYGMGTNSDGSGSKGTISNTGAGTVKIAGGSKSTANGIQFNATNGGTGTISNAGAGDLVITAGNAVSAYGITYNAYTAGSTGFIANEAEGNLTISGGSYESAFGISYNGSSEGTGTVTNNGKGTLTISGGSGYFAAGISSNAHTAGTGLIKNSGSGNLIIVAGSAERADGMTGNAVNSASGTISNEGDGRLTIQGGSVSGADGISVNAELAATGTIRNVGSGTLTIRGGTASGAYGLECNANAGGSTGTISNAAGGTLNIMGDLTAGSYGIGVLASNSIYGGAGMAVGRLDNAGTMNLNKNAIESFGDGDARVTNRATGTVNAEAEAIFSKSEGTVVNSPDISVFAANADGWTTERLKLDSFQTSGMGWRWTLKDDWANNSVWEDGGKLVITDVMEGSTSAQQISAAFQEKFGTGTSLTFKGENDDASTDLGTPKFTVAVANDLIAKGYAGAIVSNFNLDASDDAGTAKPLVVGAGGADGISDSIGFRQIQGASSVTVTGGRTLALVGAETQLILSKDTIY